MPSKNYKISFCTVCMNNEAYLQQNLLKNIQDNEDYNNVEFVIVDCSTHNEMKDWLENYAFEYIKNARLVYYNVLDSESCYYTKAKNIAFNLSTGDIICNINSWDFTGAGLASYINDEFNLNDNIILSTLPFSFHLPTKDHPPGNFLGKLCVKKSDFIKVRGFDERMIKFGNEDQDLVNRLLMHGINRKWITNPLFCKLIDIGVENFIQKMINNISHIYIKYCTPAVSEILFLYRNNYFEKGVLINNATSCSSDYNYSFLHKNYKYNYSFNDIEIRSEWSEDVNENTIVLDNGDYNISILKSYYKNRYDVLYEVKNDAFYYMAEDPLLIERLWKLNSIFYNSWIMEDNLSKKRMEINSEGFGTGVVFKNFDS